MADERNIAHDKKVMADKKDQGIDVAEGTVHAPQPGMKPKLESTVEAQQAEKENTEQGDE